MAQFKGYAGASETQLRRLFSYLYQQDSVGLATDGVLAGLGVTQAATANKTVLIGAGSAIVQDTGGNGAVPMANDSASFVLDVLTGNPMGATPRNDIVVFDAATTNNTTETGGLRAIIGTPNASPTDPTVPATAVPLARLRHAASATTVPTSAIDDLRTFTTLATAAGSLAPLFRSYVAATMSQASGSTFGSYTLQRAIAGSWPTVGGATALRAIPKDGYYRITARASWGSASATGTRSVEIRKGMTAGNASSGTRLDKDQSPGSTSSFVSVCATVVEPFNAGDNFGVVVIQSSGANLDLLGGQDLTWVEAEWIRPL